MKRVKCKSGIVGWQCKLQFVYISYEEWESYSEVYGLADRLGYASPREAWEANPVVRGSVNLEDYEVAQ